MSGSTSGATGAGNNNNSQSCSSTGIAPKWDQMRLFPQLLLAIKVFNIQVETNPIRGVNTRNSNSLLPKRLDPTPLLVRILGKCVNKANPFPDLLVDSRCSNGGKTTNSNNNNNDSLQIGAASSLWQYFNTRPSTQGKKSHPPLYLSFEAVWERKALVVLYAIQLLLELSQQHSQRLAQRSSHAKGGGAGNGGEGYVERSNVFEEEVLIISNSDKEAQEIVEYFRPLASLCGAHMVQVKEGEQPPKLPFFFHHENFDARAQYASCPWFVNDQGSNSTSKNTIRDTIAALKSRFPNNVGVIVVTTLKSVLQWERRPSSAEGSNLFYPRAVQVAAAKLTDSDKNKNETSDAKKKEDVAASSDVDEDAAPVWMSGSDSEEGGSSAAAATESAAQAKEGSKDEKSDAVPTERGAMSNLYPHLAALVVEDIATIEANGKIKAWDGLLGDLMRNIPNCYPYPILPNTNPNPNKDSSTQGLATSYVHPHFFWLSAAPLSSLSPEIRVRLHRKNRFYCPLLYSPPFLPSSTAALLPSCAEVTYPSEKAKHQFMLVLNEADRQSKLIEIIEKFTCFKRILVLTHHKEVRSLYQFLATNTSFKEGLVSKDDGGTSLNIAALNQKNKHVQNDKWKLYYAQRSDNTDRQRETLLSFSSKKEERTVLVAWDAFAGVDVMDVDMVLQCYPPQKSLCDREWAEFIQVLHTTVNYEAEIESNLLTNPNNSTQNILLRLSQLREGLSVVPELKKDSEGRLTAPAPPAFVMLLDTCDVALTANYMRQYYFSGGSGVLKPAAEQCSLSSVATMMVPAGGAGNTPATVPLTPPSNYGHVPVLNIATGHPLFRYLVCGERLELAEEAIQHASSKAAAGDEEQKKGELVAGMKREDVKVENVLKLKLRKEKFMQNVLYASNHGDVPGYLIPCTPALIATHEKIQESNNLNNNNNNNNNFNNQKSGNASGTGGKNNNDNSGKNKDGGGKKNKQKGGKANNNNNNNNKNTSSSGEKNNSGSNAASNNNNTNTKKVTDLIAAAMSSSSNNNNKDVVSMKEGETNTSGGGADGDSVSGASKRKTRRGGKGQTQSSRQKNKKGADAAE